MKKYILLFGLLAAMLVLLLAACGGDGDEAVEGGLAVGDFNADSFLPGSLPGIALQRMSVRTTDADIEDYMGSRAEVYYDYRLIGLVAAMYEADTTTLSVEIAQFTSALNAYGMHALTRSDRAALVQLGTEGYREGNSLYFTQGPYTVTISAFDSIAGVSELVQRLARSISADIGGSAELPEAFGRFPERNRIAASYRYFPTAYLERDGLDSVFTCRYAI